MEGERPGKAEREKGRSRELNRQAYQVGVRAGSQDTGSKGRQEIRTGLVFRFPAQRVGSGLQDSTTGLSTYWMKKQRFGEVVICLSKP